jgi:membrane protein required for colicin V production
MLESITAFDGIALAVVVISGIMGFARGFLRELATLGAFIGALAAAYYAREFLPRRSFRPAAAESGSPGRRT